MVPAGIVTGFLADEAVTIAKMGSGSAASGDVATADGSGAVTWETPSGGGGGGSFDLHDDVTGYIGSGALSGNDRMVVSDESLAGDPNRYAEVDDVVQRLYALGLSEVISTGTPADNDLVFIGDTSRGTGNRVRAIELSDLLERLDVGDIGSGSATDGQVPTADGSGGIAWEDQEGGGGGSNRFDLYDDVTDYIGNGNLALDDRMVVADISETGQPQNYVEVDDVLEGLHDKITGLDVDAAPANNDRFAVSDVSRAAGFRVRGLRWDDLLGYLPSFDLHDDVSTYVGVGATSLADRLVISDESETGDPNRYTQVSDLIEELHDVMNGNIFTGSPAGNDFIAMSDISAAAGDRVSGIRWSNLEGRLEPSEMDSGSATDGQVLTADGSGAIAWEAGGGGGSFDLFDDVPTAIGAGNINLSDRMVVADVSETGDPNRYVTVRGVVDSLHELMVSRPFTADMGDGFRIPFGNPTEDPGEKIMGVRFDDFVENLTVG